MVTDCKHYLSPTGFSDCKSLKPCQYFGQTSFSKSKNIVQMQFKNFIEDASIFDELVRNRLCVYTVMYIAGLTLESTSTGTFRSVCFV